MDYSIGELARLSGVSTRALRFYESSGLLKPKRNDENGYRLFDTEQVDRLQQILFFRELGFGVKQIGEIMSSPDYNAAEQLKNHLKSLFTQKERLEALISSVETTIECIEEGKVMSDKEKFEALKKKTVADNEMKYGKELRKRFGDELIDNANEMTLSMDETLWNDREELEAMIKDALAAAVKSGNAASDEAKLVCKMHEKWLKMSWPEGVYSKETHLALAEGYLADDRFKAYYDAVCDGGCEFLVSALRNYCA